MLFLIPQTVKMLKEFCTVAKMMISEGQPNYRAVNDIPMQVILIAN